MNKGNCDCNPKYPNAPQNTVLRKGGPACDVWSIIPSYVVPTSENLKGLKDAFVHVQDINTTYYINNLHQPIITWKGPLFIDNYDYENNPKEVKDNVVYDKAANKIIVYDAKGNYTTYATGELKLIIDSNLSTTSRNPVQNSVITNALNEEAAERDNAIGALRSSLDTETSRVNALLNQPFVNDITIDPNMSTDVLRLEDSKKNILTGETTSHEIPLPVASAFQAGVMNAATFNAVAENSAKINNLLGASIALRDLAKDITQAQLTAAYKTATGQTAPLNGARIYDVANDRVWTYYENLAEWEAVSASGGEVSVSQFTNDTAGVIKGSAENGQVFAEADGTGSVNGWDSAMSAIANNTSALENKLDTVKVYGAEGINITDTTQSNIRIGVDAAVRTVKIDQIAIGRNSKAWGVGAICIGGDTSLSQALGIRAIALGATAYAGQEHDVAIGSRARVTTANSVALGYSSKTTRDNEVSIGESFSNMTRYLANVTAGELDTDAVNLAQLNSRTAAISDGNTAGQVLSLVTVGEGEEEHLEAQWADASGGGGVAYDDLFSTAGGVRILDSKDNNTNATSIVIGQSGQQNNGTGENSVGIGNLVKIGQNAQVVALGYNITASSDSVALGSNVTAYDDSVTIGLNAKTSDSYSISIGLNSKTTNSNTTAVGVSAEAASHGGTALGNSAKVQSAASNSVAIGTASIATRAYEVSFGSGQDKHSGTYRYRYLGNVKDGVLDHDAATVGQLNAAVGDIETVLNTINSGNGGQA